MTVLLCDLVGFTARAEALDPEDVSALLGPVSPRARGEPERHAWTPPPDPAPFVAIWSCNGTANFLHYCDARVTKLLKASNSELDPAGRAADFRAGGCPDGAGPAGDPRLQEGQSRT